MNEHALHIPEKSLLRQDVYTLLRDSILHGHFPPGERLPEDFLASTFATSRTPIREALQRLEVEGFVQALPRRGYVVAKLSSHELTNVYEIRLVLESYAAETAITRITDAELDALERNHEESLTCLDLEDGVTRYVQLNSEFHGIIYRVSGNARLADLIRQYMEIALIYYGVQLMSRENRRNLLLDHERIIQVLHDRDQDAIGGVVRQHVRHGESLLHRALAASEADSSLST